MDHRLAALAQLCPEANFLLVSDHGFAAGPTRSFYPNAWLRRQGLARPRRFVLPPVFYATLRAGLRSVLSPRTVRRWKQKVARRLERRAASGEGAAPPRPPRPAGWPGFTGMAVVPTTRMSTGGSASTTTWCRPRRPPGGAQRLRPARSPRRRRGGGSAGGLAAGGRLLRAAPGAAPGGRVPHQPRLLPTPLRRSLAVRQTRLPARSLDRARTI